MPARYMSHVWSLHTTWRSCAFLMFSLSNCLRSRLVSKPDDDPFVSIALNVDPIGEAIKGRKHECGEKCAEKILPEACIIMGSSKSSASSSSVVVSPGR